MLKFASASTSQRVRLEAGRHGNVNETGLLWKQTKGLPYVSSAILYRGQYVMVKDGGMVTAYDAASRQGQIYQKRLAATGGYYASPVAANGNVYFTSLDDGSITVLAAGAPKLKVVAENPASANARPPRRPSPTTRSTCEPPSICMRSAQRIDS